MPLVGPKSHFFTNLEAEINGLTPEKRSIIEFENINKQPKSIKGGQMKDYQVGGRPSHAGFVKIYTHSSSTGYPSLLGCIKMVRSSMLGALLAFNLSLGMNSILGDEMGLGKTLQVSQLLYIPDAVANDKFYRRRCLCLHTLKKIRMVRSPFCWNSVFKLTTQIRLC